MNHRISKAQKINITLLCLFLSIVSLAQTQELETHFASIRNKQTTKSFSFTKKNETQSSKLLRVYLSDTLSAVRAEAYFLLGALGLQTQQKNLKKDIVSLLIRGWRDADSGINGQVANALGQFQLQDFDRTAIDSVKQLVQKLPTYAGRLFKLVGYLALKDQSDKIKFYLEDQQSPLSKKERWVGYIALARLGDQHSLDLILNRVRTFGVNDDVVYEIFPDLVYTRSYRAISYLVEVLFSNETKCESPNAESTTKMNCAYRIMELLAPVIKDYPVALSASGDLVEKDYPRALTEIRAWFKSKDGKYEIVRNTF